jgi:hypothetical protein
MPGTPAAAAERIAREMGGAPGRTTIDINGQRTVIDGAATDLNYFPDFRCH